MKKSENKSEPPSRLQYHTPEIICEGPIVPLYRQRSKPTESAYGERMSYDRADRLDELYQRTVCELLYRDDPVLYPERVKHPLEPSGAVLGVERAQSRARDRLLDEDRRRGATGKWQPHWGHDDIPVDRLATVEASCPRATMSDQGIAFIKQPMVRDDE